MVRPSFVCFGYKMDSVSDVMIMVLSGDADLLYEIKDACHTFF